MTVQLRDHGGTTRLNGDLLASDGSTGYVLTQQADGTYAPAAGASPTVQTHESIAGNNVAIANGLTDLLTWDGHSGTALLNLSVVAQPTIVTAGVYAFSVVVDVNTLTAGGRYWTFLHIDYGGNDYKFAQLTTAPADITPSGGTITAVWYLAAGASVAVEVQNEDGVASRNFKIYNALVQRLS